MRFWHLWTLTALLFVSVALGHDHDGPSAEDLARYYEAILRSTQSLLAPEEMRDGSQRPYFFYSGKPDDKRYVNGSALESVLYDSLRAFQAGMAAECPDCRVAKSPTDEQRRGWVRKIVHKAKQTGIEITGAAYENLREHGIGFAVWFWVFESFEHFVLDPLFPPLYAVPMCPIGMAMYAATVGTAKDIYLLGSNPFGGETLGRRYWNVLAFYYHRWKFSRRTKWIFTDAPQSLLRRSDFRKYFLKKAGEIEKRLSKTCFWGEVYGTFLTEGEARTQGVFSPTSLRGDIDFVFSDEPADIRWDRVFRHTEGLFLIKDILSEWIRESWEKGEISTSDYFRAKGVAGRLGKLLKEYRRALASVAGARREIKEADRKREHLRWLLLQILEVYEEAANLAKGDRFTARFLNIRLKALLREHQEFKASLRPGLLTSCWRVLSSTVWPF